ncbi:MAG: flagellar hook protein FlgE [Hyphomicrobiales bacterium]|nr:MAG: flagellar hook protein FlgE [Hyphomicrobiales bacterium]
MSISGALATAVSALSAQSNAFSNISNNLANVSTTGYKASTTSFVSLLSSQSTDASSSGSVAANTTYNNTDQGVLVTSSDDMDLAIEGEGFFSISKDLDGTDLLYTRAGDFDVDDEGYIVGSGGYYLMGWATDEDGTVVSDTSSTGLSAINVDEITSTVAATTEMTITGNLPADAAVGDSFTTTTEIYDSLGSSNTATLTYTKTADNTWTAVVTTDSGTVTSSDISLTFNEDGTIDSATPTTLTIEGWDSGAADSSVEINFGTSGDTDGLVQYDSGEDDPTLTMAVTQDGLPLGNLTSISIDDDGSVIASFDNGDEMTIAKIPVATFANSNGLTQVTGTIYTANLDSGVASFYIAGTSGTGTIAGGMLESSTTDTSTEFSNMMTAQQAYSSAAQVMTAANELYDTLLNAVR